MGYKIVLTTDRIMASNYHRSMFFGFSACIPQGTLPDWLFYNTICLKCPVNSDGSIKYANCGTRKIESALLKSGFQKNDIIIIQPDYINKFVSIASFYTFLCFINTTSVSSSAFTIA